LVKTCQVLGMSYPLMAFGRTKVLNSHILAETWQVSFLDKQKRHTFP